MRDEDGIERAFGAWRERTERLVPRASFVDEVCAAAAAHGSPFAESLVALGWRPLLAATCLAAALVALATGSGPGLSEQLLWLTAKGFAP